MYNSVGWCGRACAWGEWDSEICGIICGKCNMNEVNLRKCERARVLNTTRQYLILDRHILYYLHTPIAHTKCTRITFYNKEGHPDRAAGRQALMGKYRRFSGMFARMHACVCVSVWVQSVYTYLFNAFNMARPCKCLIWLWYYKAYVTLGKFYAFHMVTISNIRALLVL